MAVWNLDVISVVYYQIQSGVKTIECRAPDPNRKEKNYGLIVPGDTLFICAVDEQFNRLEMPQPFTKTAQYVRTYRTARELFEHEGLQHILPGFKSIDDAIELMYSFPGYKEREARYGMIAIGLQ